MKIDGLLLKHYHLKPWELEDLTLTECSLMLLALREDDGSTTISEQDDPLTVAIKQERIQHILEAAHAYAKLTPEEKLNDALKEYGR